MNFHHPASFVVVGGKKGTGKTTKFHKLYLAHKARWKFNFDPRREMSIKLKIPASTTLQDIESRAKRELPICFDPHAEMFPTHQKKEAFNFFVKWVYEFSKRVDGVKLFTCDEFQKVVRAKTAIADCVIELADDGRKEEIDILAVVNKGMHKIHEEMRDQITDLYIFQTTGRNSLQWLEEDFDDEEIQKIRGLKTGQFLHKSV
jgi:KaiC/GvpD/RAD55 family RecA-like ATPase